MASPPNALLSALLCLLLPAAAGAAVPSLDDAFDLHDQGRWAEALAAYRAVAAAAAGSAPETAGTALDNACVLQMDLGDYRTALADCRQAVRLRRGGADVEALALALNNLGLALEALGRPAAERCFREALELNRRRGDVGSQAINLGNLGNLALGAGRYGEALRLYGGAAELAAQHAGEPWAAAQAAVSRINQGVALEKLGAFREALDLYRGSLAAADLDARQRAALLVNTGVLYRNLGDPVRAAAAFRQAISAYGELGDAAALSNAHLNLGLALHLNLARPAEAEAAYREALRLAGESGDRAEEVQDLFYLGRFLLEQKRPGEAEAAFRRCLAVAGEAGSAEGLWAAREGLGRVAAARGDLRGALGHLEGALAEIERVRAGIGQGERRAGFFGDKRAVYAATVEVLAALAAGRGEAGQEDGWAERAFAVVQRAKARDLLDALARPRRPQIVEPLTAGEVRALTRRGAVLEYFAGERRLFVWVGRSSGVKMVDLGPAGPVLADAAAVHRALARGRPVSEELLARLSRTLLAPVGPLPEEDLKIAPDGVLHYLPFELLEMEGRPLVERAAVSYLPSASALGGLGAGSSGRTDRARFRLLGVGDPRLGPALDLRSRAAGAAPDPEALLAARFDLPPLLSAGRELAAAARQLGGPSYLILTGSQATERGFRTAAAQGARVIHLATHAVADERPGRGAAVLLTPEGEDDGLLLPAEIAALDAGADLTVLAALGRAGGAGADGRALVSLTGAFLAAGSRGVVATLWDVGDQETAVFMEQLYHELARGRAPAEALRRVKLRLRQDPRWRRPELWAGYVLVGEPPPVARPWWRGWAGWAAVLGGAAVLAWLGLRLRRRRTGEPG